MERPQPIEFTRDGTTHILALPPPGNQEIESKFAIGLIKAGSVMLNQVTGDMASACGLVNYRLMWELWKLGLQPQDLPASANSLFARRGYLFGGFRSVPEPIQLPGWASGNIVVLVRDPRDMMVSFYYSFAFNKLPPQGAASADQKGAFEQARKSAKATTIDDFALAKIKAIRHQFYMLDRKLQGLCARRYRYEDIIFDKAAWIADMADYLKLDLSAEVIATIVARHDIIPASENPANHIRKATPGDYKEKLKSETIKILTNEFSDIIEKYSYH